MNTVTRRRTTWTVAVLAAFALVVFATPRAAQAGGGGAVFTIDHYLIHQLIFPIPGGTNVGLKDQFGSEAASVDLASRFGVPVDKNFEGIRRPDLHLLWWDIFVEELHPIREVVVFNQFGDTPLQVHQPRFLLTPALKNPDGTNDPTFVTENHYKCYDVNGDRLEKSVNLQYQFGADTAFVLNPVFLCNPVEKTHIDGITFPPAHPSEHLVCYKILIGQISPISLTLTDQFVSNEFNEIDFRDLLCVPSLKEEIVQVEDGSWGKIKSIYR